MGKRSDFRARVSTGLITAALFVVVVPVLYALGGALARLLIALGRLNLPGWSWLCVAVGAGASLAAAGIILRPRDEP